MDTRTVNHMGMIEAAASMAPISVLPISSADENWQALPQRLRGRGDFLLKRGRIKDAELMFDAATEIEALRLQISPADEGLSQFHRTEQIGKIHSSQAERN